MRTEAPRTPAGVYVSRDGFVRRTRAPDDKPDAVLGDIGRVLSVASGWSPTAFVPIPGRAASVVRHVCLKSRNTRREALFAIVAMVDGQPTPADCDHSTLQHRTDGQVADQTNKLAHVMYGLMGYKAHPQFLFWHADRGREQRAWNMARQAQIELTATDPNDALDNLGWEHFG